jgi:hypothetical protein
MIVRCSKCGKEAHLQSGWAFFPTDIFYCPGCQNQAQYKRDKEALVNPIERKLCLCVESIHRIDRWNDDRQIVLPDHREAAIVHALDIADQMLKWAEKLTRNEEGKE